MTDTDIIEAETPRPLTIEDFLPAGQPGITACAALTFENGDPPKVCWVTVDIDTGATVWTAIETAINSAEQILANWLFHRKQPRAAEGSLPGSRATVTILVRNGDFEAYRHDVEATSGLGGYLGTVVREVLAAERDRAVKWVEKRADDERRAAATPMGRKPQGRIEINKLKEEVRRLYRRNDDLYASLSLWRWWAIPRTRAEIRWNLVQVCWNLEKIMERAGI